MITLRELERHADRVKLEAEKLLARARDELVELAAAEQDGLPHAGAKRIVVERRVATMARQFTRAQALLVAADDPRAAAARQVVAYCDEADDRVGWSLVLPPVALGAEAVG